MPFENSFNRVIREVEKDARVRPSSEKYLLVEKRKKEVRVLQKGSLMTTVFGGQLSYYIVGNDIDASNAAEGRLLCSIRDFNKNRVIDVVIDYEVSCPVGQEETVLYALCSDNLQPQTELERKIQQCVAEYSRLDGARFIDNYVVEGPKLSTVISSGVQQETGLSFRARISLDRETELQPFLIQPTLFKVRVQDCDDNLDLHLNAELAVDELNKVKAVLKFGREFELANILKEGIRKYFRDTVLIQEFYSNLSSSVRDEAVKYLDSMISAYGRKISFLTLSSPATATDPKEFDEFTCPIDCKIYNPESILFPINNTLQMELRDIGKYRMAQTPNLQDWARAQLEPTIKAALFEKNYVEVLLEFGEIAESIKKTVEEAASEIGYSVKQIISRPQLKPLELIKDFDLEIKAASFKLKDAKVEVRLNIVTTLHIPDLQKISSYLTPNVDLKDPMRKDITVVVRRFLNKIEPERFYMRFSYSDDSEAKSIEDELSDEIKKVLEEKFKATVSGIVIRTLDTAIKQCYEDLFQQIGSFELEFNSFKDGKPVYLKGDFQVNGVEQFSWYTFQSRTPKLPDIEKSICKSLHAKLSNLPSAMLTYNNIETQKMLEKMVEEVATKSVVKQFGLRIEVVNVTRRLSEIEELKSVTEQDFEKLRISRTAAIASARQIELAAQMDIVKASSDANVAELTNLLERRASLIADPDENEEELEALNEKIEQLQINNTPSGSVEEAEAQLKAMRLKESDANYLLEFSRQMKSLNAVDEVVESRREDSDRIERVVDETTEDIDDEVW